LNASGPWSSDMPDSISIQGGPLGWVGRSRWLASIRSSAPSTWPQT
jgi:hypothetical protein